VEVEVGGGGVGGGVTGGEDYAGGCGGGLGLGEGISKEGFIELEDDGFWQDWVSGW
jgi:hypothetical protein